MSIIRKALQNAQPNAEQEIAHHRFAERTTAKLRQEEVNRRVAETAVDGFINPDDYKRIKMDVTAEIPTVNIQPSEINEDLYRPPTQP